MKKNKTKENSQSPNFLYIAGSFFGFSFWLKTVALLLFFAFIIPVSIYYTVYLIQNRTYLIVSLILMFVTYSNILIKSLVSIINLEKYAEKEKIKKPYTEEEFSVYPLVSFNDGDNPFDYLPKA